MLYDVPAPAKVNLFLHVVGRRSDGYHLLQTVFQFIDLCDTLHFDVQSDGAITRDIDVPGVAEADDLTLKAARALQSACGVRQGVRIRLEKRIPTGGGLGGGSSDAASTLIALNRLWGCGLSRQALMQLALPLGADVPVFVFGQPAFAEGVGEKLTAVCLPPSTFVVAQPQVSVPTPQIFRDPYLTRDTFVVTIADFLARPNSTFGRNDLESVACRLYPEVGTGLETMAQCVANVLQAQAGTGSTTDGNVLEDAGSRQVTLPVVRMSGSGACTFVQCQDPEQAELVEREIVATMRGAGQFFKLVQVCSGLNEHPLRSWIAN